MHHILGLHRQLGIGRMPATEDDFWRIAADHDIDVVWSMRRYAFFFQHDDVKGIVLPRSSGGVPLLFTMFHELGHALMHVGESVDAVFAQGFGGRFEYEADAFALLAVAPTRCLRDTCGFGEDAASDALWQKRLRLYEVHRL